MKETKEQLDFSWNKNIVYNIGHSACSPSNKAYFGISKLSAINQAKGEISCSKYTFIFDDEVEKSFNFISHVNPYTPSNASSGYLRVPNLESALNFEELG